MKHYAIASAVFLFCSGALALDATELALLRETVKDICVTPDRMGDYLRTEGEVKVGAPVLVKIVTGELSGKLTYEQWKGISIATDKYKTDPRQCAIEMMKILQPSLASSKDKKGDVYQSNTGSTASPNIYENNGNVNINADDQSNRK